MHRFEIYELERVFRSKLNLRTQYIRDFPRSNCTRNMSEEKSTTRQGLSSYGNGAALLVFKLLAYGQTELCTYVRTIT